MIPQVSPHARRALHATVLALAGAFAAAPASAQIFGGDDEARQAILKARQEIAELRAEDQRGRLQLASQIEQLQQQMALMRGQMETLSKQVSDAQQAQREMSLNLNEQQSSGDASSILGASDGEQTAYDTAIDFFRQGQYKNAAEGLGAFVQQYPRSGYAPTAQFYLGSSLYALKDYKNAITRLQGMVQAFPDNARAPDALLVIAGSQIELSDRSGARATLQRIVRDYGNSQAAGTARDRLQLLQ